MGKEIVIFKNDNPIEKLNVTKNTKIKDIKTYLKTICFDCQMLFYLNEEKQITNFDSKKWDNKTLKSVFDKIDNGIILLYEDIFSKIPKDLIIKIALNYSLHEITKQCQVSKKFNNVICNNETFWKKRLIQDYQIKSKDIPSKYKSYKEYYKFISKKSDTENEDILKWSNNDEYLQLFNYLLRNEQASKKD